jgi:hypothetical protein
MEARRFPMEDGGEYLMTWEVEETIEARLPGRWQYRPYLVGIVVSRVRDLTTLTVERRRSIVI